MEMAQLLEWNKDVIFCLIENQRIYSFDTLVQGQKISSQKLNGVICSFDTLVQGLQGLFHSMQAHFFISTSVKSIFTF
jgi:hypothetical protein